MTHVARFASLATILVAGLGISHADTLNLASYGSTNTAPTGVSNTATLYNGGTSYNVPTGNAWTAPVGVSSWVSNNPNDYPGGGSYVANKSTNVFTTTFQDLTPGTSSGSITVMADDTTSVYLNGVLIASAAPANAAIHCTVTTPNCTSPVTFDLTGFIDGTNTLTFDVSQDFDNAMGVDYTATVMTAATPEPGSLMLLGTGLLGMSTRLWKRRVA